MPRKTNPKAGPSPARKKSAYDGYDWRKRRADNEARAEREDIKQTRKETP